MGVSITAYSNVELVKATDVYLEEYDTKHSLWLRNPDFDRSDNLPDGFYTYDDEYEIMATAYGSYGQWRDSLSQSAYGRHAKEIWGISEYLDPETPFLNLIHFSDCEGFLGPQVCAQLYTDFTVNKEVIQEVERVDQWIKGLELAANTGVIKYS